MVTALYARISTRDKGQDTELQLRDLRERATREGWAFVEYIERGKQGSDRERPELARMMSDVDAGKVNRIVVWKLDRFTRSVAHLLDTINLRLRPLGVDLVSCRENIDTSSASGMFFIAILGAFAEMEKESIRERVIAGMELAREKGTHLGRPRCDVSMAAVAALRGQGMGARAIARELDVSRRTIERRLIELGELGGGAKGGRTHKASAESSGTGQ